MKFTKDKKFWRVLAINVAVILICGTIVISLPIIFAEDSNASTPTNTKLPQTPVATEPTTPITKLEIELTADYFAPAHNGLVDLGYRWQIRETAGDQTVTPWQEIYDAYCADHNIIQKPETLLVTADGLIYAGDLSALGTFTGEVTFNHRTVTIMVP